MKIEEKYTTELGSNIHGSRHTVNSWISESEGMCASMSEDFIKNGKGRLEYCKKKLDDGRRKWESLEAFAKAYLDMAATLTSFASQSVLIMQTYSYCNPGKYDHDMVNEKCKWKSAMDNLLTKTFDVQGRALFLSKAMQTLDTECSSGAAGWPFSQSCSRRKCNYKFAIMIEKGQWEEDFGSLNEEGIFVVLEEFYSNRVESYCLNKNIIYHWPKGWQPYGGITVYAKDLFGTTYISGDYSEDGCKKIQKKLFSSWADNYFLAVFGAIPNFGLKQDFPKCAALLDDVSLWGPLVPTEKSLKRYPSNLTCKETPVSVYTLRPGETEQACWIKCYYEAKLKPNFFFTVDHTFPGVEDLCLCHSTW